MARGGLARGQATRVSGTGAAARMKTPANPGRVTPRGAGAAGGATRSTVPNAKLIKARVTPITDPGLASREACRMRYGVSQDL